MSPLHADKLLPDELLSDKSPVKKLPQNPISRSYPYRVPIGQTKHTIQGLTFPEIIILLLLLGTLVGISAPGFIHQLKKIQVKDALLRIQGALRETQAEAIRRNQTCTLTIPRGTDKTITGNCLITGDRPLKGINLNHNNPPSQLTWSITFDYKGRNQSFQDRGTLLVSSADTTAVPPQCLVISIGIGLMRIGEYSGNPNSISAAKCVTS